MIVKKRRRPRIRIRPLTRAAISILPYIRTPWGQSKTHEMAAQVFLLRYLKPCAGGPFRTGGPNSKVVQRTLGEVANIMGLERRHVFEIEKTGRRRIREILAYLRESPGRKNTILHLANNPWSEESALAGRLGISSEYMRPILNRMMERGYLQSISEGGKTYWALAHEKRPQEIPTPQEL